jgi:hypothetical protein
MASPVTALSTLGLIQQSTPSVDKKEEEKPVFDGNHGNDEGALQSSKGKFWVTIIIASTYIAALVLAGVHHAFLVALDHRSATKYSLEERQWIGRASNLLSRIIATSLGVVVVTALIQGVRVSHSNRSYFNQFEGVEPNYL